MSGPGFEFNAQQKEAMGDVEHWFKGWRTKRHRKQLFRLGGFAGTGKTSVAQTIAQTVAAMVGRDVQGAVVFIAPTGKAASRLRQKGCKGAMTLHQFVYNVAGEDEDGDPIFVGKGCVDAAPVLVIMDESSMVGGRDLRQVMEYGFPILQLGDTGQVDPVNAECVFTEESLDYQLTDIMRQGALSNIIRASMFVRKGKRIPPREYEDMLVTDLEATTEDLLKYVGEDAQILCSYNNTREAGNAKVRAALGFTGLLPMIGEKIVCTANQHAHGIMNGEQGIVLGYEEPAIDDREDEEYGTGEDEPNMMVRIKSLTNGREMVVCFDPRAFSENEDQRKEFRKKKGGFDYGYFLTVHKSQGSEWPKVLVFEELMGNYARLMYTAITRAQLYLEIRRSRK